MGEIPRAVFLGNLKSLLVEGRTNFSELHICRQQKTKSAICQKLELPVEQIGGALNSKYVKRWVGSVQIDSYSVWVDK
jgi:hypothetical protein